MWSDQCRAVVQILKPVLQAALGRLVSLCPVNGMTLVNMLPWRVQHLDPMESSGNGVPDYTLPGFSSAQSTLPLTPKLQKEGVKMQGPLPLNTDVWLKLDSQGTKFQGKLNQPHWEWVNSQISRLLYRASGNWECFVKVWAEAELCGWQTLFSLLPLTVPSEKCQLFHLAMLGGKEIIPPDQITMVSLGYFWDLV